MLEDKKDLNIEVGEDNLNYLQQEQHNSFKLTKNSKGVNYEFKIIEDDLELLKKKVLELNEWAKTQFEVKNV